MRKICYLLCLVSLFFSCTILKDVKEKKTDDYVFKSRSEKAVYIRAYNKSLSLWKVPYVENDVVTSHGKAHVIICGPKDAKPLVLLHGMDASSTMWFPNIEALAKNHRVYAIDFLLEPGKSVSLGKSLSKEEIVTWYNEIFTHYDLKKIYAVGASRGGWIATLLATQKNSKISKLVLLSPAQTFESVEEKRKASSAVMLKLFPDKKKWRKTLKIFSYHPEKINRVFKSQFYLANKFSKTNTSFLQMQPFSNDDLKSISIPVLVLIGDHDVINSEDSLEKAQKILPNFKGSKVIDAGHFLTIDQSGMVNKKVVDFLKE